MSDWTHGYVTDVEYTFGYYSELNPLTMAVPLLHIGLSPPPIATACELGFGQGLSINIHAAASPVRWWGTDFNPAHAAFAQWLAEAAGSEAQLSAQSFAEFCARPDLPEFDYIALHGVWSWVSEENQRVIVDFLDRKLKVGGVAYFSYNTLPGHSGMVPLRHLMMQHTEAVGGAGLLAKREAARGFVEKLLALNTVFAAANPSLAQRLAATKQHSHNYLAHEFFNRDWHATPFADMVKALAEAKLSFACSAHYLDHVDALNLTPDQHRFLAEIPDPLFRQSVRDFIVNQQFRRDYWVKGGRRLTSLEQTEALRRLRVMLATGRSELSFTVSGALGQREMASNIYTPILDALDNHRPKTIGEVEQAVAAAGMRFGTIFEAIMVLAGKGDLVLVQDEAVQEQAKPHADRLNARIMDRSRSSGDIMHLASPVIGGGIGVPRFHQLFLLARGQGRQSADEMAGFAWEVLSQQGQVVVKDGKPLEKPEDNLAELAEQARDFADKRLPLLQRVGIA